MSNFVNILVLLGWNPNSFVCVQFMVLDRRSWPIVYPKKRTPINLRIQDGEAQHN